MLSVVVFLQDLRARLAEKAESGQGLAEYGLILALVAVLAIGALKLLGGGISNSLSGITSNL